MIPPTSDKSVLRHSIDLLRVRELPTAGSDLAAALRMAHQQLRSASSRQRAILLISDGELSRDNVRAQQQLTQLVTTLRQDNIHLYTLGVGTAQGAALLDDQNGWLQQDGQTVVSRLHAKRLQTLAQQGNGAYASVADDDSDWHTLYDAGIARLRSVPRDTDTDVTLIWHDLSAWFVLPGVLLLLLAYGRLPRPGNTGSAALMLGMLMVGACLPAPPSQAADNAYPAAYAYYHAGNYQAAADRFARLPGYAARMGEGASLYQLHHYPQAATAYIQAVLDANTDGQRGAALFNLGNSYFKQQHYDQAATTYRDVLRYAPTLSAAKTNLAYAQALLDKAKQNPRAPVKRAGTGPHMAPAAPDTEVGKGRVGIDASASKTPAQRPRVVDTSPQQTTPAPLLQQAKPVTEQIVLDKDVQWTYDITRAQDIQAQDTHFTVDETVFWQRLFEVEEDFPAPRAQPEVLPGVAPW
jgi:Ca-activated chloride channel family protein